MANESYEMAEAAVLEWLTAAVLATGDKAPGDNQEFEIDGLEDCDCIPLSIEDPNFHGQWSFVRAESRRTRGPFQRAIFATYSFATRYPQLPPGYERLPPKP